MKVTSLKGGFRPLLLLGLILSVLSCTKSTDQEITEKGALIGEWRPISPYLKNSIFFSEESGKLFMRYKSEKIGLSYKDGAFVQDHALGGRVQHKGDSLHISGSETYYIKKK